MKLTEGQRLRSWLDHKKISQSDFGVQVKASRGQVNNWCTSAAPIPAKVKVKTIEIFPDLPARWFLTGEGEMLVSKKSEDPKQLEEGKSEYKITKINCSECIAKQREIDALKKVVVTQDRLIEMYEDKKKASC